MDTPEPTAGHPLGYPPGQPSKMDTLLGRLDGASGHQGGRPPRPTAWPDAFLWSSAVVHPCGLAEEYEMTNDSVPHTVGCGGDRPLGCPPLCGPAGCSSRCPAVQDGSVHPDRQCGWAVGDQAERPCSANPLPHRLEVRACPRTGQATRAHHGLDHAAASPSGARRPGHRRALVMQPSTARRSRSRQCRRSLGGQCQAVELGRPRPRRSTHPGGGAGSWPSSCGRRCGGRGGQGPRSG